MRISDWSSDVCSSDLRLYCYICIMTNTKLKAGITFGDINGIGLEVIMKTLLDNRIKEMCTPVVYGSVKIASFHRKALGIQDFSFQIIKIGRASCRERVCQYV